MNPLFEDTTPKSADDNGYVLPRDNTHHIRPQTGKDNPAVEMIRHKIDALYQNEPSAKAEAAAATRAHVPRSKHQDFMYKLTTSGKPMAEIQTAWHNYYTHLPDAEKHEVWQEFYNANTKQHPASHAAANLPEVHQPSHVPQPKPSHPKPVVVHHEEPIAVPQPADHRSVASIKKQVLKRVRASNAAQTKAKQHLQSLVFGLGVGALVLLVFLFGLFNEMVVTPFIKPSSKVAATPIILNSDAPAPSATPELIIPKINVQLPLIYGGQSLAEADVQKALEDGVFHYPTTALPGQKGNAAYFGHSSNNIFNKGKYKFAFVLLKDLEPGDIFYLTYDSKVFTYKVYGKKIVNPDETWVLGPVEGKPATATLITCDPPGTTLHRLVVWGEQISPDPSGNVVASEPSPALQTQALPGKGPTAWSRLTGWLNPFD